ncbi:MAG: hypothetical protein LBQ66_01450, partial [Planctomycetaceae bacterium]|nr:hypothetical protein [Planctomycetaceae bacterium]
MLEIVMFDAGGIESGRVVLLSADEREVLCRMVADNTDSAGRVRRAKILLAADSQGAECNFGLIAKNVGASVRTVRRVCERYVAGGLRTSVFASRFNLVVKLCRADRICLNKILSDNSGNSNNSGTKNANTFNLTKSTSVAATKCNIKFAKILTKADADGEAADVGEIAAYSGATKRTVVRTLRTYIESGLSAILISRKLMRFRLTDVDRRRCELLQVTAKSQKIRKQAAILLNADRLECVVDFGEVAKLSGVSKQTVLRNCKKYKSGGLDNVINTTPYKSRLPKRRYAVRLTSQERDFLNRLTTTHKSGEKYKRGLILLNADERGVNRHNTEIAKIADVNVQTVLDVCRRYNESGLKQLFGNTLNSKSRFNVAQNAEIDRVPRKRRFEINLTKQER